MSEGTSTGAPCGYASSAQRKVTRIGARRAYGSVNRASPWMEISISCAICKRKRNSTSSHFGYLPWLSRQPYAVLCRWVPFGLTPRIVLNPEACGLGSGMTCVCVLCVFLVEGTRFSLVYNESKRNTGVPYPLFWNIAMLKWLAAS